MCVQGHGQGHKRSSVTHEEKEKSICNTRGKQIFATQKEKTNMFVTHEENKNLFVTHEEKKNLFVTHEEKKNYL